MDKRHRKPRELPPFYYEGPRGFWIPNARRGWVLVKESALRRELKLQGYSPHEGDDVISPLERAISEIQKEHDVSYAGPLAGYPAGLYEILGRRILVTESPKLVEPKEGEWPMLREILEGMLNEQCQYLFSWLKLALTALISRSHQPGQALVLAGEPQSGKSLLQGIITQLLGGRESRPFRYMRGGSEFNSDLFGSEHLVIEDEAGSSNPAARRWLATKVKELTANNAQSCHPKGRQAFMLTPFWRVSVSLNCEPHNLSVLPTLDQSVADKLIILRTRTRSMPMPTDTCEQQKIFRSAITAELPAFAHFLMEWEIPSEISGGRFGVRHFHHPEIVAALSVLPPETQLMNLIDRFLVHGGEMWIGTADELQSVLITRAPESKHLFPYPTSCGFLLSALEKNSGGRVRKRRSASARRWEIAPMAECNSYEGRMEQSGAPEHRTVHEREASLI